MHTSLFEPGPRQDAASKHASEGTAAFLDRTAHPPFARTRNVLDEWFSRLPADGRNDIRGRFRSKDDLTSASAFWELYMHELLLRNGFHIEIHPHVTGTTAEPDFLARRGDAGLYVEATRVGPGKAEVGRMKREQQVYDSLRRVRSPDFDLGVDVVESGQSAPKIGPVRRAVETWLDGLDPDEEERRLRVGAYCTRAFSVDDWVIELTAYPRTADRRGSDDDPIGPFVPGMGDAVDDIEPIRAALKGKRSRYGCLDHPYVIALLGRRDLLGAEDVAQALFGRLQVRYTVRRSPAEVALSWWERDRRGFFASGDAGVDGVLVTEQLEPWRVAEEVPQLWLNPSSTRAVPELDGVERIGPSGDRTRLERCAPARSIAEVLGLPKGWPFFSARRS